MQPTDKEKKKEDRDTTVGGQQGWLYKKKEMREDENLGLEGQFFHMSGPEQLLRRTVRAVLFFLLTAEANRGKRKTRIHFVFFSVLFSRRWKQQCCEGETRNGGVDKGASVVETRNEGKEVKRRRVALPTRRGGWLPRTKREGKRRSSWSARGSAVGLAARGPPGHGLGRHRVDRRSATERGKLLRARGVGRSLLPRPAAHNESLA